MIETFLKYLMTSFARVMFCVWGAIVAILEPQIPFLLVCTLAVLFDAFTAWSLSRRVKKRYPGANDGKFKSCYFGRVVMTLIKIYALIILVAFVEAYIFEAAPVKLVNIVAGAVCFWQIWSMLENESSCNDTKWAKIAQRILVDKTERHFDIDLHELKEGQKKVGDNQGSSRSTNKNTMNDGED